MVTFKLPPGNAEFDNMKTKIEACLRLYDGTVRSYDDLDNSFDDLFHDSFSHILDGGNVLRKDEMRETAKWLLSMGASADLLLFKILGGPTFELKLHFVTPLADIQTHLRGRIEDGQLINIEQHRESRRPSYARLNSNDELHYTKKNFELLIELQNDKDVTIDVLQDVLDSLFDDSLVSTIVQAQLQRRGMRTMSGAPKDFSVSKFKLEKFERMDAQHVEVKVLRECVIKDSKTTREEWHDVFTINDGAILGIEPCADYKKSLTKKWKSRKRERKVTL